MPQAFDNCRAKGGKIRTLKLSGQKYVHVCILNGKTYRGEVKKKKKS
jgi:putative hemolysin